jgi:hypothetical protein
LGFGQKPSDLQPFSSKTGHFRLKPLFQPPEAVLLPQFLVLSRLTGEKRRRAAAVQDAGATGGATEPREASGSAPALGALARMIFRNGAAASFRVKEMKIAQPFMAGKNDRQK